jgi:hypothetical protein
MILDTNALSALAAKDHDLIAGIRTSARVCTTWISLGEFKYGLLLSRKRDELEGKKDRLLEQKQEIEREMQEVDKRLHRINNAITKNDVLRQIRANKEYKKKVNQKVSIIKEAKADGDSDDRVKTYIETQAEVLVEQEGLPFEIEQMERVLELLV